LYVSYVLSRIGFNKGSIPIGDEEFEPLYTTQFDHEGWLEALDFFEIVEEPVREDWLFVYEDDAGEKIWITFVSLLVSRLGQVNPVTGESTEAAHLYSMMKQGEKHLFIVHPRLSRKAGNTFRKTKQEMKDLVKEDVVLSTGEFISRTLLDERKRKIVEANWESLRDGLLARLQSDWPILTYSIHEEELSDIQERLRRARLKYELGVDFEEVIKESGIACEGLLRVLCSISSIGIQERMLFNDMLSSMRITIQSDFGDEIFNDLDMVRQWRNNVLHHPVKKVDKFIVLRVLTKAELFHELFHQKMKRSKP
jgi:hypothetical protein